MTHPKRKYSLRCAAEELKKNLGREVAEDEVINACDKQEISLVNEEGNGSRHLNQNEYNSVKEFISNNNGG